MHDDPSQVFIPDSFLALYAAPGRKPSATRRTIESRHDFCEDLANVLVEHCRLMQHRDGLSEDVVLERCLLGLLTPHSNVVAAEAEWVIRRTAELLQWPWNPVAVTPPN